MGGHYQTIRRQSGLESGADVVDLLFRGGTVVDGSGGPSFTSDVAIQGGEIVAIGKIAPHTAKEIVDIDGLAIAPGFIDVHTHDDRYVLSNPDVPAKLSQGVTTVITGNCGISLAPSLCGKQPPPPLDILGNEQDFCFEEFADYLAALDANPAAVNIYPLVGLTTLRVREVETLAQPATIAAINRMQRQCANALAAGALGVSIGTFYPPASAATANEIIAVADSLKRLGGMLAVHLRDETDRVADSITEAIDIAEKLRAQLVISHHKVAGAKNHGRSSDTLAQLARAAMRQPVSLDVYPYAVSSTSLRMDRVRISSATRVASSHTLPQYEGWDVFDVAADLRCSIEEAVDRLQPATASYHLMSQVDVDAIVCSDHSMIGSDGLPHDRCPHPRLWGAFPRVLGAYVRERKLLSLPNAIRKMTSLPAMRFGIRDRGWLLAGKRADVCVFDPERVGDRATFDNPTERSVGIEHVMTNGVFAVRDGIFTRARAGKRIKPEACTFRPA